MERFQIGWCSDLDVFADIPFCVFPGGAIVELFSAKAVYYEIKGLLKSGAAGKSLKSSKLKLIKQTRTALVCRTATVGEDVVEWAKPAKYCRSKDNEIMS